MFAGQGGKEVTKVGAGSVIKGRFELVGTLGRDGMGVVYKAQDRIKMEAKDRYPFVAIKVLNEDFKDHPESLIANAQEEWRHILVPQATPTKPEFP